MGLVCVAAGSVSLECLYACVRAFIAPPTALDTGAVSPWAVGSGEVDED
jgi:hypothetical protein